MFIQGKDKLAITNIIYEIHREKYNIHQHIHHNTELLLVLDGKLTVTVNERTETAEKGQFILLFPFQKHSLCSEGACFFLIIAFSISLLSNFAAQASGKVGKKAVFNASPLTVELFLKKLVTEETATLYGVRSCLFAMLDDFISQIQLTENDTDNQAMYRFIIYVSDNYKDNLSLQKVAKTLGYSSNYLSHCISKTLGMNYRSFLGSTRAEHAKFMLRETNQSILEIALECGYPNLRSFQRHFKSFSGVSPSEYRDKKIIVSNANSADGPYNAIRRYVSI